MEQLELLKKRYSVRNYKKKPVEEEKLNQILEAARVAPTGANRQPYELLVLRSKEAMDRLSIAARTFNAPLAIVVLGNSQKAWTRHYDSKNIVDIDASIIADHMMIEATALDLGTVWVCNFKADILKETFNIPAHLEPVNILIIGYGEGEPASPERHQEMRRSISDFVHYNGYSD